MERKWSFYKDLLPILVLIGNQCNDVGLFTLFKAATLQGLNNYVFVVYAYAVATTILIPLTFLHRRARGVPPLSFFLISKIFLLGLIGSSSQILGYAGISYSSPTLSSSISNLVPAFTFMLAVIFRMEKLAAKSRSSQAKVLGSIISIAGAFVSTLYQGPSIINAHAHLTGSFILQQPNSFLKSEVANWVIGGILLTAEYFLMSVWYILQADILKVFPDELTILFFYTVTATITSTIVGLFMVPNASAWKIGLNISLISILCTGPVYVTSFTPLQIVAAVAMGVMFLGDTLYIGSIVGAIIISTGVYAVLWGKATENIEDVGSLESPSTENVPLLQTYGTETSVKKTDGNV